MLNLRISAICESTRLMVTLCFFSALLLISFYEFLEHHVFAIAAPLHTIFLSIAFTSSVAAIISWIASIFIKRHYESIKIYDERIGVYRAAMQATTHYIGNALNAMQLLKLEFEDSKCITEATVLAVDEELRKTEKHVRLLAEIENPTKQNVGDFVKNNL